MSATHQERIERLQALFARISPPQTAPERCVDVGRLEALWRKLVVSDLVPALDDQRLRILSAEQRLIPAKVRPAILSTVISGVAEQRVLTVKYRKASSELSTPRLHPQALVQRGPVIYLVALKNDEPSRVQFYALHRMVRVELTEEAARAAAGFDLDRAIAEGLVDFGRGETIALELRVRGYLTDVLEACPLAEEQLTLPEPEDSDFDLRLHATVPSSGALLRWLLAGGDNLEVVAPDGMRRNVAAQINKASALYADVL